MRRYWKIAGVIMLCVPYSVLSQHAELRFGAESVYSIASKFTGDSTCWPIIVSLSNRETATNSFILNAHAQARILDFSAQHRKVKQARFQLNRHISSGAKLFATGELDSVSAWLKNYDESIRNGNISGAAREGKRIEEGVGTIQTLIAERRTEAIDATLAQKTGIVDKRKGLLGLWQSALIGDLFASYDGVRTSVLSFAQLYFVDGVEVMVDPNTTVVIRESRLDKLDRTIKRDIALTHGSILTRLSVKAKETNKLFFRAGTSESTVRSGKFWATALQDKQAKVSNYDGTIDLTASNVKVTLSQNQGTVVEKGKAPLPPVNLLPAPLLKWERLDSVVYSGQLTLQWQRIDSAAGYLVEWCSDKNFDRDIQRISTKSPSAILRDIPISSIYVRMQTIDRYGLRGVDSPVYRILRVKDERPPAIQIDGWDMDRKYTANDTLLIRGKTKGDAKLEINGTVTPIRSDGSFSFSVAVDHPETPVKIVVTDQSGKSAIRRLSILPMEPEQLFRIQWNDRTDETTIFPQGESLEAHGTAYPKVKVDAELGVEHVSVQTNSQGEWAIALKAIKGGILTLSFESLDDQKTIGSKSWKVE